MPAARASARAGGGEGKNKGIQGVSPGYGSDSGSASSTKSAGISGVAGNSNVRTGDAQIGIDPIFDKDKVQREIDAQVLITQTFLREAPKAAAKFAQGKINDLKAELKNAEGDEATQAEITAEIARWEEGGVYRVAMHTFIGGWAGGVVGAASAGTIAAGADAMDAFQAGLEDYLKQAGIGDSARGIAQGVATIAATGVGAVIGGGAGAATAVGIDANNRQLHPAERQIARRLAARSGGRYTVEQIEEQMRLMGNDAYSESPNTTTVLTDSQAIQDNLTQDPGMPKVVGGNVVVELPGQYNAEIQQFIIVNTTVNAHGIPGATPYTMSNPALNPVITVGGGPSAQTASCANGDTGCITGIGQQQNAPLTLEERLAAGQYFGQLSTNYQRIAGVLTASGNAPLALGFEVSSGVAAILEQMFTPSTGKVVVDSIALDLAAKEFSTATGIPLVVVNEVVEQQVKPRLSDLRAWIDRKTGTKNEN